MSYREIFEFERSRGRRPVAKWLSKLSADTRGHVEAKIDQAEASEQLRSNVFKPIKGRDGIFEFIINYNNQQLRILACKHPQNGDDFVLLSGHVKKAWKLKSQEFDTAEKMREELNDNFKMAKEREW